MPIVLIILLLFVCQDFTAAAEDFVAKSNNGRLVMLEKNQSMEISMNAKKDAKTMVVVVNTRHYNSTAVLAINRDFSVG